MLDRDEVRTLADQVRPVEVAPSPAEMFARLVDSQLEGSYRLARAILGAGPDVEDAVQEAFLRAWRGSGSLRDADRADAWFATILVNTCRNMLRSRPRARLTDISGELDISHPVDEVAQTQIRDEVGRALAALDPDHRLVVALRYHADLPVERIAVLMAIPAGTVKSRLHHALRELRAILDADRREGTAR